MDPDEELARQLASSASLVARRMSSLSVDLLTDVSLIALERAAARCGRAQRTTGSGPTLRVMNQVGRIAPPLAGRAAYATTYVGARGGFAILKQLTRTLSDVLAG